MSKIRVKHTDRVSASPLRHFKNMPTECAFSSYLADVNKSIIERANSIDKGGFTEWSKVLTKCRTKTCVEEIKKTKYSEEEIN